MAQPPRGAEREGVAVAAGHRLETARASATTSGPMPSPGNVTMRAFIAASGLWCADFGPQPGRKGNPSSWTPCRRQFWENSIGKEKRPPVGKVTVGVGIDRDLDTRILEQP